MDSKKHHISWKGFFRNAMVVVISLLTAPLANAELTAAQAVNKGATTLMQSKGIKAQFSIRTNGKSAKGQLTCKGNKFALESPVVSTWYNGTSLYTYNPRTRETTVVKPTAAELSEANPLAYIHANKAYTARDLPAKKGKREVAMTPNTKGYGVKVIYLTLNPTTYLPECIKITADNGVTTTIDIDQLQLDALPDARVFEYPKNKFPKAEVIDMR